MIVIVDYGMGNLGSIANMLRKVDVSAVISSDISVIAQAKKLILPGVGSFDHGMDNLLKSGILSGLTEMVLFKKIPILGICLGMQLMTKRSEEGKLSGLGWIDAETMRFKFNNEIEVFKIPHMGWNTVDIIKDKDLFGHINIIPRFYFVHSYYVICSISEDVLSKTHYGHEFVSAYSHENITAVQFHPEKSHKYGMLFMKCWATR